MTDSAVNALQCEMDFLSGVGEKLEAVKTRLKSNGAVVWETKLDHQARPW